MKVFWVTKNVAFGPIPTPEDYEYIGKNFDVVISLIEEEEYVRYRYNPTFFESMGLKVIKLPTQDFRAPNIISSMWLLKRVQEFDENNLRTYIHCVGGYGRSGSLLAAYLVFKNGLSPEEAIFRIREIRPGSVQAREQEKFVERVYKLLSNNNKEKISNKSSEFIKRVNEEVLARANAAVNFYVDVLEHFSRKLDYYGGYLKILNGFMGELEKDDNLLRFSIEFGEVVGDKFSYAEVISNGDNKKVMKIYCLSYCEHELFKLVEKYKESLLKNVSEVIVEYV